MKTKIYEDSKNYTCQVIKLPAKVNVPGLDNLVEVNVQGNSCLIGKDSDEKDMHLFFPAESQISHEFLSSNNLYRHSELNEDKTKTGFFDDNRRVKAVKFKGIISSGFVIPIDSLKFTNTVIPGIGWDLYDIGMEFNEIEGIEICRKYHKPASKKEGMSNPRVKVLDGIVDAVMVPEHPDTSQLLKNIHKLGLNDYIAVTYKLHGTSARYFNTLTKRKLSTIEKIAKFFGVKVQVEEHNYVSASRRAIKSISFETLPGKNHYYSSEDIYSAVGKEYLEGKLKQGEAMYCEIIGKTYGGSAIQGGYSYGFDKPQVYVYRISNINSQGVEVDLSYLQMKERAIQMGLQYCPELFYGTVSDFIMQSTKDNEDLGRFIQAKFEGLMEKPSILDSSVVEEGFCVRKDTCNKPEIYKIKSKLFLLHEGRALDKELVDMEEEEAITS